MYECPIDHIPKSWPLLLLLYVCGVPLPWFAVALHLLYCGLLLKITSNRAHGRPTDRKVLRNQTSSTFSCIWTTRLCI